MVNAATIAQRKDGVLLVNVSRGGIFNTQEMFDALKSGKIAKIEMDVYELEHDVFFVDHSQIRQLIICCVSSFKTREWYLRRTRPF